MTATFAAANVIAALDLGYVMPVVVGVAVLSLIVLVALSAMRAFDIDERAFFDNPAPRLAIGICVDCSPSMRENGALDELNEALGLFYDELREDELTRHSVEPSVIGFCGDVTTLRDFGPLADAAPPSVDVLGSYTSLGSGVERTLDLLEERKASYKAAGVEYYQPWLVILTDGQPTDTTHLAVAPRIEALVQNKRLVVMPIWLGGHEDADALAMLSPNRPPLRLKGLRFKELFEFIKNSASLVGASKPGDVVKPDTEGMEQWAEI